MDDFGLLTFIVNFFHNMFYSGLSKIQNYVLGVTLGLITIDGVFFFIGTFWGDGLVAGFFPRLLKYSFYAGIVMEYPQMIEQILVGFFEVGAFIGGGSVTEEFITTPSLIMEHGWALCERTYAELSGEGESTGFIATLRGMFDGTSIAAFFQAVLLYVAILGITFCFALISLQVALTVIEFYIVMPIAYLLIPFGILRQTAFMAEKAFGAIVTFGVKVCALAIVTSVIERVLAQISVTAAMTARQAFFLLILSLFMAFLVWTIPGVAASACGGSPSLGAGGVAGAAMGAAGMAMSGGRMAMSGGRMVGKVGGKVWDKVRPPKPPPTPSSSPSPTSAAPSASSTPPPSSPSP
jgi:type IV secretion system protein TrbL